MVAPASVPADGNLKATWVPVLANPLIPKATELNAAGSVELSEYLTSDGFTSGGDEAVIADERLASRATFERPGRSSTTLDLAYVHNPASATDNDAYEALPHLTEGFVVTRWGVDFETAWATADVADVMPAQCGIQRKQSPEANSVLRVSQKIFITGEVRRDVAVVAGP